MINRLLVSVLLFLMLLMTGCGGVKVWPFEGGKQESPSYAPANAVEYNCEAGKKFYVRMLNNNNDIWLILPEREVGLPKSGSEPGKRYSNGISTLNINGDETTLEVNANTLWKGCKATIKK